MFLRTTDVYPHVLVDHVAQLVGLGFWHMNSTQVSFACEHGYHSQFSLKFAGQVQIPASRIRDEGSFVEADCFSHLCFGILDCHYPFIQSSNWPPSISRSVTKCSFSLSRYFFHCSTCSRVSILILCLYLKVNKFRRWFAFTNSYFCVNRDSLASALRSISISQSLSQERIVWNASTGTSEAWPMLFPGQALGRAAVMPTIVEL
jgi:hypothetical protein